MQALGAERPVIIDESDGPLDAFVTGRALGYSGVSSKACKGVWRSFINLARCRAWNEAEGRERFFIPNKPAFLGLSMAVQALVFESQRPTGVAMSRGLLVRVGQ